MDLSPSGLGCSGKLGELEDAGSATGSGGQPSELSEEARRSERVTVRRPHVEDMVWSLGNRRSDASRDEIRRRETAPESSSAQHGARETARRVAVGGRSSRATAVEELRRLK